MTLTGQVIKNRQSSDASTNDCSLSLNTWKIFTSSIQPNNRVLDMVFLWGYLQPTLLLLQVLELIFIPPPLIF